MVSAKKRRRRFSKEFKRETVALLRRSDKSMTAMAQELGISMSVLRDWVTMVEAEEKTGLSPNEVDELVQLRKENARLKEEVEILGKATAFFATRRK